MTFPVQGYCLRRGSGLDRALLVKFLQRTYRELNPDGEVSHLVHTVEQYFGPEATLWWVEPEGASVPLGRLAVEPVACLWLGNAVHQITGDRQSYIFLLYVTPPVRRQGIGTALMHHAEAWARQRGDRQIGLQVFQTNQPALKLYEKLGYQSESVWMIKLI